MPTLELHRGARVRRKVRCVYGVPHSQEAFVEQKGFGLITCVHGVPKRDTPVRDRRKNGGDGAVAPKAERGIKQCIHGRENPDTIRNAGLFGEQKQVR